MGMRKNTWNFFENDADEQQQQHRTNCFWTLLLLLFYCGANKFRSSQSSWFRMVLIKYVVMGRFHSIRGPCLIAPEPAALSIHCCWFRFLVYFGLPFCCIFTLVVTSIAHPPFTQAGDGRCHVFGLMIRTTKVSMRWVARRTREDGFLNQSK